MKLVLKGKRGQGMTEYILIIALVAVLVLGSVKLFGGKIKAGFNKASDKVGTVADDMDSDE
jgi:Flp pilus assembly pilin Flp